MNTIDLLKASSLIIIFLLAFIPGIIPLKWYSLLLYHS